ncbi:hypothetical protein TD95_003965 [Thielaviopsis punctulata]|uniref:HTH APSES-type domain-containing protein n=1 Tax=Thielaviopsis punctulata TaxID=72032 RepID=A0A0F4Z7Q1_9PEZI|nr:hypothetical protein TD95_003965 [Thielaviopsis punctulata]
MSQSEMYYQHIPTGQQAGPQGPSTMAHYQPAQPPLLHPSAQYPPPSYNHPYYATLPSQAGPGSVPNSMGAVLPPPVGGVPSHGPITGHQSMTGHYPPTAMDTTGQIAPPGMKPRVTATLWEDEGSLCFQVEARGICVARREDNHMINGTKLLNVAGMTRGRRDGILKSEKIRHVVKIGPMHLKGVWIPFERALDFANKEKITELLYPLFVHNISALLCHPANQSRANQAMAAHERRKQEQGLVNQGLPSIHQPQLALPGPQPLASHTPMARPGLDRAHTFPTPPATAGGVLSSMGSQDGFQWGPQQQGTTPSMPIDSNEHNGLNFTPATTPPGSAMAPMQAYSQAPTVPSYDSRSSMYSAPPPQQSPYQTSPAMTQDRVYQAPYVKTDMAPPTSRSGSTTGIDHQDKSVPGIMANDQTAHVVPHHEQEAEHENEYTHDSTYDTSRAPQYNYPAPTPVAAIPEAHIPNEAVASPAHGNSGRATPRTAGSQNFYPPASYPPSPRSAAPNAVFSVVNNERTNSGAATPTTEIYSQPDLKTYVPTAVVPSSGGGMKRSLDDEDDRIESKRRKTGSLIENGASVPYDAVNRPNAVPSRRR